MSAFFGTLRALGPARLMAIGIVAVAMLGFFTFLTTRMGSAPMSLLYADLEQSDAAAMVSRLQQQKIPHEISADGRTLKVASNEVGRARMALASEGLPRGGSVGYEIFDQKESFGTTSFVQNVNHLRALEGELARTISTLANIASARVHLVLPQRELFSRTETQATASVFIKLRGSAGLDKEQVTAIQNLLAAAVPKLQPNQISIVDDRGNLLARPKAQDSVLATSATQDEIRQNYEQTQAKKIEDLLAQSLGFGKVRAQVSVEMDFDRVTTQSEIFDPESQVVRSQQTTSEQNSSASAAADAASLSSNLPGGEAAAGGGEGSKGERAEETINYEINKTIRSQVRESGQIRRMSVAVVVDGLYSKGEADKLNYTPRTSEEMEQIKSLVRSAVNMDTARGDTLEVVNMRFIQEDAAEVDLLANVDMMFGFPKEDLFRLIEIGVLGLVGILVLLLVVRPLLNRAMEATGSALEQVNSGQTLGQLEGGGMPAQLAGPAGSGLMASGEEETSAIDQLIDIGKVEGRVKATSIKKVGELVDAHTEESVAILRNWMNQEGR